MKTKNLVHDNDSSVSKTVAIAFLASAIWSAGSSAVVNADGTGAAITSNQSSTTEVAPSSDTPVAETPKNSATSSTSDSSAPASDTPSVPEAPKTEDKGKDGASNTSKEEQKAPETPTTPSDSNADQGKEKGTSDTGVVTEKPKPAVEVPKQNNDTVGDGTVLQPQEASTPTVTPTVENPVITDQGYKIVDVSKSTLTLENADGTNVKVKPELIGGVTNGDGTVTIKSSKGELETLPETGVVESMFLTFIGFLFLILGFKLLYKNKAEQPTYTYL